MTYSDYVIYVDVSGDHGLEFIDRDYPVFVLEFCIFGKGHFAIAHGSVVAPRTAPYPPGCEIAAGARRPTTSLPPPHPNRAMV